MPLHLFQPCMCDSHVGKQATRGDVRTSLSMRTQLIFSTTNSEPLMMLLQFLCMNVCLIPPCRSGAGWGPPSSLLLPPGWCSSALSSCCASCCCCPSKSRAQNKGKHKTNIKEQAHHKTGERFHRRGGSNTLRRQNFELDSWCTGAHKTGAD